MTWKSARHFLFWLAAAAVVSSALVVLLPQDKALRYRALRKNMAPTADWIYRRIHEDQTPIDAAFIGTSRTGMSVHSVRLQEALARSGVHAHAVNLHTVKAGRNMHYAIAKELLTHRKIKLLVLELTEWEDRKPHPEFVFLADSADILLAPLFINVGYLSDLARLPGRQFGLFVDTQLARWGGPDAEPPPYAGPNLDHAEFMPSSRNQARHYNTDTHSQAEMESLRREQDAAVTPELLPRALEPLEYRLPRYYIAKIFELAEAHGARVALLYTPRYGGPALPPSYERLYAQRAPLLNPWPVLQDHRLWSDATHVNWYGAQALTDNLAEQLIAGGYFVGHDTEDLKAEMDSDTRR